MGTQVDLAPNPVCLSSETGGQSCLLFHTDSSLESACRQCSSLLRGAVRDDVFSLGVRNPKTHIHKLGAGLLAAGPILSPFINRVCVYGHFGDCLTLQTAFS